VINTEDIVNLSHDAGKLILAIYQSDNFEQQLKSDDSPLTKADLDSHNLIVDRLRELTPGIPILSEESVNIVWQQRKKWKQYWLIDPLDGTKEFIKKNGEFTVNIALIKDNTPVLGVVYAPVLETTWVGEVNKPAIRITPKGRTNISSIQHEANETWNIVGSRSHQSDEFRAYVDKLEGKINIVSMGSSIKLCFVAEGSAHIYPRLGLTSEWDTAAAHSVVNSANGKVVDIDTGQELKYNIKDSLLNPFFIVSSR
jgi:3'(2'), 5'-bisphosphate nucleotidase